MDPKTRSILLIPLITLATLPAGAQTGALVLEVTFAEMSPSPSQDAAWGWWNPSKADTWLASSGDDDGLAEVRLLSPREPLTVFLAAERFPTLEAESVESHGPEGAEVERAVSMKLETYDLGISHWFGIEGRFAVMPWVAVTHMRIAERRTSSSGPPLSSEPETGDSRLWGVGLGANVSARFVGRWAVMARVCGRWARGDRTAHAFLPGPAEGGWNRVEQSDTTDRTVLGAELGLRWSATPTLIVDCGWRYRSWRLDRGPGSFGGPFLRLIIGF